MSRPRLDYDPIGIPIGGGADDPGSPFILLPRLDTQLGWESNVFREDDNPQDDFFLLTEATLDLRSDWELHSFGITRARRAQALLQENQERLA